MSRYRLTPVARDDLAEIFQYIQQDSPQSARRVLSKIRAAMRRLGENPGIGHTRKDLTSHDVRFWPVFSFLIIFQPQHRSVQILRVLRGTQDVRRVLEQEPELARSD